MSEESQTTLLATCELHRKLDTLEQRAARLSEQYDTLIARANYLETATATYMSRVARDQRGATLVELLMRRDNRSTILVDYVWVFFESLLRKVQTAGAPVSDINDLWLGLQDTKTHDIFTATVEKLGFTSTEQTALLQVFEVVGENLLSNHHLPSQTSQSLTEDIMRRRAGEDSEVGETDSQVASVFLYLQIQDELHTCVRACLRRVVALAHCSLMGVEDQETTLDISNLTAPGLVSRFLTSTTADKSATASSRSTSEMTSSDAATTVRGTKSDQTSSLLETTRPEETCDVLDAMNSLSLSDSGAAENVLLPEPAAECGTKDTNTGSDSLADDS